MQDDKTMIVGGFSPHIFIADKRILELGPIIGINRWPMFHHCDYWIALDSGVAYRDFYWLPWLTVPKYMRTPNPHTEAFVPKDLADYWFDTADNHGDVPRKWNGTLAWTSSTALAAINLAIVLGAENIILFGVDFVGDQRADGHQYRLNMWDDHQQNINILLNKFKSYANIYRTHPDSWLDCDLFDYDRFISERSISQDDRHDSTTEPGISEHCDSTAQCSDRPEGVKASIITTPEPQGAKRGRSDKKRA